ncbi:MAG: 30S ribosomal protein S3 [Candidatus Paceibacterota bacterium]
MSHVVHPYSHRLGIIRDWKSRWFGTKSSYINSLRGDIVIRNFLDKKLRGSFVGNIDIERQEKAIKVIIETSRPGMVIGKKGEGSTRLKKELLSLLRKRDLIGNEDLRIDIQEIKSPESNSSIVAQMIAEGLEKRLPFRRVVKQTLEKVMANRDVEGVKIIVAGRLGGADMARREKIKQGRVPLQTLRADIDFSRFEARLPYGTIGIQVWIYKGELFDSQVRSKIAGKKSES